MVQKSKKYKSGNLPLLYPNTQFSFFIGKQSCCISFRTLIPKRACTNIYIFSIFFPLKV